MPAPVPGGAPRVRPDPHQGPRTRSAPPRPGRDRRRGPGPRSRRVCGASSRTRHRDEVMLGSCPAPARSAMRWPCHASRRPSKSSRQWAPRDSSRSRAEASTAVATVIRLVASHDASPGSTPCCSASRASSRHRVRVRSRPAGPRRTGSSPAAWPAPPPRRPSPPFGSPGPAGAGAAFVRSAGRRCAARRPGLPATSWRPADWPRAHPTTPPHRTRTARPGLSRRRCRSGPRRRSSGMPAPRESGR